MPVRILLVDSDAKFLEGLTTCLTRAGFEIHTAADGAAAIVKATTESFGLLILDMVLPLRHGFDVCREIRARAVQTPILMLSSGCDVDATAWAFKVGADHFMTKPLDFAELLARIDALLRRSPARYSVQRSEYRFGKVVMDFQSGRVIRAGETVSLSLRELKLLQYLIGRRGTPVHREELLSAVWGFIDRASRTLDVHIAGLRQKLEEVPRKPRHIRTARGVGYMFHD